MRKTLFSLLAASSAFISTAQVITFEGLSLPNSDTFFVDYSQPAQDVGFDVGSVHFPCVYDTVYGGVWSGGFAYSNKKDSVNGSYTNDYAAKPAVGFNGSDKYAVYFEGYSNKKRIILSGDGEPPYVKTFTGFYGTNSTYVYSTLRDGNFVSRKFGDTTGTGSGLAQGSQPDWFKLTIHGYDNGAVLPDSVEFYLADYRFNDNDSDYIVRDWTWVDLSSLGGVIDSLEFELTSTDNGSFGMNTPAYFCMDDLTPLISTNIKTVKAFAAKIYPNPAINEINVEVNDNAVTSIFVTDLTGKRLAAYQVKDRHTVIPTAQLPSGMYMLQITNGKQTATQRFIKQ